jgi:hypothetical protein
MYLCMQVCIYLLCIYRKVGAYNCTIYIDTNTRMHVCTYVYIYVYTSYMNLLCFLAYEVQSSSWGKMADRCV